MEYHDVDLSMKTFIMEIRNILQADLLDIIFEGRNKSYGAYALRKTYNKRMITAMAITVACCLLLYTGYRIAGLDNVNQKTVFTGPDVFLDEVPDKEKKVEDIPLPKPKKSITSQQVIQSTTPLIVKEAA